MHGWYSPDIPPSPDTPRPIGGFGAVVGEWHPNQEGTCCPALPDMVTHGYYQEDDARERANMVKYNFPPGSCTAIITKGKWPTRWACNLPNAMILDVFRKAETAKTGVQYATSGAYIDAIASGQAKTPPGFPPLYAAPVQLPRIVAAAAPVTVMQAPPELTGPSKTKVLVIGIAAIAAVGAAAWFFGSKESAHA